ncbi:glycosyltransferase family 2 protein [Campylobacter mucosalis]|uniref:glycosyltransferase family 2 protein n=1 Tax=Campylobacter mucosalis TaxID=202 RepID=UPI0014704B07|nr:glycosyltransferase family 2 protein [Campylobacter mucosalis]QKF63261.1 glycosyltransferase, family 2 [Campylobacter mucosalis]
MKKISIIIPIYNSSSFLQRCVTSLLEQDFKDIEYIFINDACTDDSMSILEKTIKTGGVGYDFKIINHLQNKGSQQTRKTGLDNASGEYVLFADSDDFYEQGMISEMINLAITQNADMVVCDMIFEYKNRQIYVREKYNKLRENEHLKALIGGFILPSLPNKLIKRDLLKDIKFANFSYGEDQYLMAQIFNIVKKVAYIPKPFFHYNKLNKNSLSTKINQRTIDDLKLMHLNLLDFLESIGANSEIIKLHRARLIKIVFYNVETNLINALKRIDKKAVNIFLILSSKNYTFVQKIVSSLPFFGLEFLFRIVRQIFRNTRKN